MAPKSTPTTTVIQLSSILPPGGGRFTFHHFANCDNCCEDYCIILSITEEYSALFRENGEPSVRWGSLWGVSVSSTGTQNTEQQLIHWTIDVPSVCVCEMVVCVFLLPPTGTHNHVCSSSTSMCGSVYVCVHLKFKHSDVISRFARWHRRRKGANSSPQG